MIYNKYLEEDVQDKIEAVVSFVKKTVSIENIIFVVLAFILNNVSFMGEYNPFSIVLMGVASVFNIPLLAVFIPSVVSMAIFGTTKVMVIKCVGTFILFSLITAFLNIQGISKKFSVYFKLLISYCIVEFVTSFVLGTLFSEIITHLSFILIMSVIYFVFVPGMSVILNLKKAYVYSKEESIAMITVLVMCLSIISNVSIYGMSIFNIIILVLLLIYGWKNGAIYGASAGLLVGLILTTITDTNISFVVTLALSSAIAGVFSRFGKIPVVIAFLVANVYLAFNLNDLSTFTIRLSELVISSIALLFIPKALEIKLDKLFNQNDTIGEANKNVLGSANQTKEKIDAISDVFESISKLDMTLSKEDKIDTRKVIKRYIKEYITNNYDAKSREKLNISDEQLELQVNYITDKLENKEIIDKSTIDLGLEVSDEMIHDIYEIYNSVKLTQMLRKKEEENSSKLASQYMEVSKILKNISKNIKEKYLIKDKSLEKLREELKFYGYVVYEDDFKKDKDNVEYIFVTDILTNIDTQKKEIIDIASNILEQTMAIKLILNSSKKERSKIKLVSKPNFDVQTSIAQEIKSGEEISGDSYLSMELDDLKKFNVISDGAGSGQDANIASQAVLTMLNKLMSSGFSESKALDIINSVIKMKSDEENFSSLDALIIDLKTANSCYIKYGAAPTYIVENKKVTTINTSNMPVGIIEDVDFIPIVKQLNKNSVVVQLSDGVVKDEMDVNDNYFKNYLANIDTNKSAKQIAEELRKFVVKYNKGLLNDDITIIVSKVVQG